MVSRKSSNGCAQWLAGLIIVAVVVIAFGVYQTWQAGQPEDGPIPTATGSKIALQKTAKPGITSTLVPKAAVEYRIVSAKANLSAIITELYYSTTDDNWDLTQLTTFAGHLEGTANLGRGGNFVLAGHVEMKDGSPGPFANVKNLSVGDPITIISNKAGNPIVAEYTVTGLETVAPDDFDMIRNHGYEELTLITCSDWNQQDHTYHTRIIVHARPIGKVSA